MTGNSLFDTHAHYDHPLFEGLGPDILSKLLTERIINGCVIPAISYESNYNRDLFPYEQFPTVYFAAGLHPKSATNEKYWDKQQKMDFNRIVDDPRTVAVKTGLDYSKTRLTSAQKEHQERFFKYLIGVAKQKRLPLILHIRDAVNESIKILRENKAVVEAVIHCFVYDYDVAEMMMNAGVTRFGINSMIGKEGMDGLRSAVKQLPLEKLMIETDAPFIKPDGFVGSVNTSMNLMGTVEAISDIKQISLTNTIKILDKNARDFYKLSIGDR